MWKHGNTFLFLSTVLHRTSNGFSKRSYVKIPNFHDQNSPVIETEQKTRKFN